MSRDSLLAAGGDGGAGNEVARPANLSRDSLLAARREITDQALFDFAAEVGSQGPVVVLGGGTQQDVGVASASEAKIVRAPTGIVEVCADDMTVCVRAGTPVSELHAVLAEYGMRTSLVDDTFSVNSQTSTVGGVIAVGRSPITRLADGHLREAVLQIRYVAADGSLVTAGGPTVKNVSGFDLCRLMVGSLGTLGCIADVTLRTLPIYPHKQWVRVEGVEPRFVLEEATTATAILWNKKTVWAQLAGHAVDVEDDLALFENYVFETPPPLPPFRWSRQPHELFELGDETGECVAEIGVGVAHCEFPDPKRKQMSAGVLALNRRVREVFDPNRRFNPSRSVELM